MYTADRILTAIDQKKTSAVVLLDMSKAFDSVNQDILQKNYKILACLPLPSCGSRATCQTGTKLCV